MVSVLPSIVVRPGMCRTLPALFCLVLAVTSRAAELTASAILDRFLQTQHASSEMVFIRMETLSQGERVDQRRFLALYQKNADGSTDYLLRLVRPEEVEGVTMLAHAGDDERSRQSILLPSVGRFRPLTGEAQAAPFLGSNFNFADLLQELPGTQTYALIGEKFAQGALCYVLEATPRDERGPYGSRHLFIEKASFQLFRIEYFDHDRNLLKTLNCYEYGSPKIFGHSIRPHRAVMTDAKGESSTVFTVIVGRLGESFDPLLFTEAFAEKWSADEVESFMFDLSFELPGGAH